MATLLLAVLYLLTSAVLAALVALFHRRPSWAAALVLTLLPLAFTASGWLPGKVLAPTVSLAGVPPWTHPDLTGPLLEASGTPNPLLADPLSQMEPWRFAARQDLLFNPSANAGSALLANGQSAPLFPLEVVARLLPPVRATVYVQAARLLLAAWGLFLLLRWLAVSEMAALLGAAVYVGSGFLQLWRLHPHASVAALAPWILWALLRLARKPEPRRAAVLGVLGALGVFAGHPETLAQILLLGLLLVAATTFTRSAGRRLLPKIALQGALAALLAALLAAPALLPFVENLLVSAEWQHRQETDPLGSLPWGDAAERLAPAVDLLYFGHPLGAPSLGGLSLGGLAEGSSTTLGTWRGPENLAELGGGATSLAALALAALALGTALRSRSQTSTGAASPILWLALGTLGLAVSVHTPGLMELMNTLPLLGTSLLKRLSLWWALAVAVAAALGWDHLRSDERMTSRSTLLFLGITAVALAAVTGWLLGRSATVRTLPELFFLGAPLVLLLPLAALAGRRLRASTAAALWMPLLLVPPAAFFGPWVPLSSADSFYPTTPAIDFIRNDVRGYRVAGLDSALVPQTASFYGLEDVRGYDPMTFAPYADFSTAFSTAERDSWNRVRTWSHPALDFLGVRYLFDHPSMYIFHHPGIRQVWEGEDALVYQNPRAFQRLFRPQEVEIFEPSETGEDLAAARRITDFARRATVYGPDLPEPGVYPNGNGEVTEVRVEGRRITARTMAQQPMLVASSQPAIPGWRVRVDGREVPAQRVNGAFLGILLLEPGEHRVELIYAPASWRWGLGAAVLGLLLLAALSLRQPCSPSPIAKRG
ncbi:MAG: YfhO family protein [Acidobacteriota bacterium]|nr:YfhO family protein [Acidobacteriota bacterium]